MNAPLSLKNSHEKLSGDESQVILVVNFSRGVFPFGMLPHPPGLVHRPGLKPQSPAPTRRWPGKDGGLWLIKKNENEGMSPKHGLVQ